jgi:hypothetical protein
MDVITRLEPGVRLYDRLRQRELFVHDVEKHAAVVFLHVKNPQTGEITKQPYSTADLVAAAL